MALTELSSGVLYNFLDGLKSRSVFSALPAFVLHMGLLTALIAKTRVVHVFENRRRLKLAFANYGLDW